MTREQLNDLVLDLIKNEGLTDVVEAIGIACSRQAQFIREDEEIETSTYLFVQRWVEDATLVESIIPKLQH